MHCEGRVTAISPFTKPNAPLRPSFLTGVLRLRLFGLRDHRLDDRLRHRPVLRVEVQNVAEAVRR